MAKRSRNRRNLKQSTKNVAKNLVTSSAVLGAALFAGPSARATDIIVNSSADSTVPGDGNCTLREAVANANSDGVDTTGLDCLVGSGLDRIQFAAIVSGTTIELGSPGQIAITESLDIDGPGASNLTVSGNNTYRIFFVDDGDNMTASNVSIEGLSLINGYGAYPGGGAILSKEQLTISNTYLTNNRTTPGGVGGAVRTEGPTTITLADFTNNIASGGGALFVAALATDPLMITNSDFSNNRANSGDGGAIAAAGNITITGGSFSSNYASGNGGALDLSSGSVHLTGVMLDSNDANYNGGGAELSGLQTLIIDGGTQITNNEVGRPLNSPSDGGGLFVKNVDNVTIASTNFSNNVAFRKGGGLFITSQSGSIRPATIRDSTFSMNKAKYGGGAVAADRIDLTVEGATTLFDDNNSPRGQYYAGGPGGAILIGGYIYSAKLRRETTVSGTTATDGVAGGTLIPTLNVRTGVVLQNNYSASEGGAIAAILANVTLNGVTLTSNDTYGVGGALSIRGDSSGFAPFSTLTVNGTTFLNNTARVEGGGISARDTNASFDNNVQIVGNRALRGDGGGINFRGDFNELGVLSIRNSLISGNIAGDPLTPGNQYGEGGGVASRYGNVSIYRTTFDQNDAESLGGGLSILYNESGIIVPTTITDSFFTNNTSKYESGAGISVDGGTLTVTNTQIRANEARYDGGGVHLYDATVTFEANTMILDNRAKNGSGGGISARNSGSVTIRDSFVSGNFAGDPTTPGYDGDDGGGLFASSVNVSVVRTEFYDNRADRSGGGIAVRGTSLFTPAVSIIDSQITANDSYDYSGGGIYTALSNLTISGATTSISLNTSYYGGGVFFNGADSPAALSISGNALIEDNTAYWGAGITAKNGPVTISNAMILGNIATLGGGGLYLGYTQATITSSVITGNQVTALQGNSGGGGILLYGNNDVAIDLSRITGNVATALSGGGIALVAGKYDASNLTITRSTIADNRATNGAGIAAFRVPISPYLANLSISESAITFNFADSAAGYGGGLVSDYVDVQLTNVTVSGNRAAYGAGLSIDERDGTNLTFLTIVENTATVRGGGIDLTTPATPAVVDLDHVIVARNMPEDLNTATPGDISARFSLIQNPGNSAFVNQGGNIIGVDPGLGPLQNNGSQTLNHLPFPTSPVVDAGDPLTPPPPPNDQRGVTRPQGPAVDIGAVELSGGVMQFFSPTYSVFENAGTVGVLITRSGGILDETTVEVTLTNGTGTVGADITPAMQTVTFAQDATTAVATFTVIDDNSVEGDETLGLMLSNAPGATINPAGSTATLTILDFEPGVLDFDSPTYTVTEEGGAVTITVNRTNGSNGTVTVNYATSNGSAVAGSDYTASSGTLTFNPGDTSQSFTVPIVNDTTPESSEDFVVTLSAPTGGATLGAQSATTVTITDTDSLPESVSFGQSTATVDEAGGNVVLTITRNPAGSGTVTVGYTTNDGTASAGADYASSSGTVTFGPGETSKTITIPILDDTLDETDETFTVTLSAPVGATLGSPSSTTVTIIDDDVVLDTVQFGAPTFSANENGGNVSVTVTRIPAGSGSAAVNYATSNGTATAGADYTTSSGMLAFGPGETSKTIIIPITNDALDELDETFTITLSSPTGATLGSPSSTTVTIVDDDGSPEISISDVVEIEGTGTNSQFIFTVRLSEPSAQPISVTFTTSDGTAVAGSDYLANSGTITFDPGDTLKLISIAVIGDDVDELDETFAVNLSDAIAATIAKATGRGTIRDDDGPQADVEITTAFDQSAGVPRFDPLTWIAEAVNNGEDTAEGVRVVIRRPVDNPSDRSTETAYKILTPSTCTVNRTEQSISAGTTATTVTFDVISCEIGTLIRNQRARIEILSLADPARLFAADGSDLGQLDHTATVSAATPDPNPSNNTAGWPSVALNGVAAQTELLIRDLRDPVAPGGEVTYTVARSGQPLPDGVPIGDLELDPSDNLIVVSLPPGCATVEGDVGQVLIRCTAFVPFGDFFFRHNDPSTIGDLGSLRGQLLVFDPASGSNETVAEGLELTTIGAGALAGDVSVGLAGPSTIDPGVPATFTLTVRNDGPQAANNVTVDVSSGDAVIAVSSGGDLRRVVDGASGGCSALPCSLGTLGPGETRNIQFTATANPGTNVVQIVASVTTSALDPNASNNVITFTTQLSCAALDSPQIFVVGSVTSEQPYTVSWNDVGADRYILEESTTRAFANITDTQRLTSTAVQYVKLVSEPREFYYRVTAVNDCSANAQGVSSIVQTLIEPKPITLVEPTTSTPVGSVQPVVTTVTVFSPEPFDVPYIAEADQPWLRITPATGFLSPNGTQLLVSIDPTGLPVGAQTATIILRRPDAGSALTSPDQASPSSAITSVPISISLVTPVTTASKTAASNDALIIPVVAHAQGASGEFRSDVRILNSALQRVAHRVLFTPSGTDGRQQSLVTNLNIDPGQTVAMDDILRKWFGLGGTAASGASGLIEIRPLNAPNPGSTIATSRTYRIGAPGQGSRGEYIAAVPLSKFLGRAPSGSLGGRLNMQQLVQNAQFRTNLGLVEGTGAASSVVVRGFDNLGRSLFTFPVNLKPGEQIQLNSIFAQNNVTADNARIEVTPTGGTGRVIAYASVLDAITSDALHVAALNVDDVAADEVVVAGVAELQGQTSRWRTDMRIYNALDRPAQATLQFYRQGSTEVAGQATVEIAAGEVKALDNVVGATLGQLNTLGAIHVLTNAPLIVTARTFNQLAATGATQGQFVPAITPSEGTRMGERSLHMLNVEQSVNIRTNLGLAEMTGSPIRVEVTAVPPDSRALVRTELNLGANEFRQFSNILAQMGLPTVYNARISVRVIDGAGRLTAYASAIDNKTDDAIFVSAK